MKEKLLDEAIQKSLDHINSPEPEEDWWTEVGDNYDLNVYQDDITNQWHFAVYPVKENRQTNTDVVIVKGDL